jgi:hypothetical protein
MYNVASTCVPKLAYVHILDLDKKGYIKPHIDAVRVGVDN